MFVRAKVRLYIDLDAFPSILTLVFVTDYDEVEASGRICLWTTISITIQTYCYLHSRV